MYKASQFTKDVYRIGEIAKLAGVEPNTIHDYESKGLIEMFRSPGGHRLATRENLLKFLDARGLLFNDEHLEKRDVIYARVSGHEQKARGDLDRQVLTILENSHLHDPIVIKETGSGLNDKRKGLLKIINMVADNSINNIYITYKDRLTRFGFNYLEEMFSRHGTKIITVGKQDVSKDAQRELVDDMMSLIASFSGKLYRGSRQRRSKKNG